MYNVNSNQYHSIREILLQTLVDEYSVNTLCKFFSIILILEIFFRLKIVAQLKLIHVMRIVR